MKFCIICNLHFGVSGGFFQGAKLRTLVYVIKKRDKGILLNENCFIEYERKTYFSRKNAFVPLFYNLDPDCFVSFFANLFCRKAYCFLGTAQGYS
ncbi:MAG: hypothetical protein BWY41_00061 [Candidatus Atribacteria bacterium ADurb.Bin276]|uniref:Uncharacterized protein n=1 Tax=Candidatus Atribacter allofermentans TaxID=1852833 RepID=A0A1V5T4D0_9BACT|nr:MAG: hypothetical protein BWY41_00061 [Candidatus Atribacteria bacterium ADurb.Bin276]